MQQSYADYPLVTHNTTPHTVKSTPNQPTLSHTHVAIVACSKLHGSTPIACIIHDHWCNERRVHAYNLSHLAALCKYTSPNNLSSDQATTTVHRNVPRRRTYAWMHAGQATKATCLGFKQNHITTIFAYLHAHALIICDIEGILYLFSKHVHVHTKKQKHVHVGLHIKM